MDKEELKIMAQISKKYHLLDMKQSEIAKEENISNSSVSRLLQKAKDLGYIKITLDFPNFKSTSLEEELKEKFNLKYAYIEEEGSDEKINLSNIADSFSHYLNTIVEDGDVISLSWGETMTYLSENLVRAPRHDVKVVQLNGGIANRNISTRSDRIINQFAENYDAMSYFLNAPSVVDNRLIAEALMQDTSIREVLDLAKEASIAVFSIGAVDSDSVLVKAGYFTSEHYETLREEGYVGDICSRYIKADGSHEDGELYNRVIGLRLEEIQKKEDRICVAIGEKKASGILAALNGAYVNTLFTDEITAREILRLSDLN